MADRACVVCEKGQKGKKVWEHGVGKRVICLACAPEWTFKIDGKTPTPRTVRTR